jgi:hypothetical protein
MIEISVSIARQRCLEGMKILGRNLGGGRNEKNK